MVAFMCKRRYYLLYGEAVSPSALANQRAQRQLLKLQL